MKNNEYGVLFRKETVSLDYNTYIFKPLTILEGVVDYEHQTFLDELNVERGIFTDSEAILSDADECIGYIMTEEELLKSYPNARNIDEAKILFNDALLDYMIMGIYDKNNNKMQIVRFNLKEMSNSIANDKTDIQASKLDKDNIDDSSNKQTISYYEKLKESFNNQEITVIQMSMMEYLISLDDLEEIKREILETKNNKDKYEEILRCEGTIAYIIPEYSIDELLKTNDIDLIKETLNNVINSSNELQAYEEDDPITPEEFIKSYSEIYNKLMNSEDIKSLKSYVKEALTYYKVALQELELYEKVEVELSIKFIKDEIEIFSKISRMKNLENAKKLYATSYIKNQTIINKVADELIKPKTYSDDKEEEKKEAIIESEKISAEEIINRAKASMNELDELIGLDNVKKVFEELIKSIIFREKIKNTVEVPTLNLNMIFKGNPGSGKTTVAHIISKLLCDLGYIKSNKIKECTAKDFIGQFVGQTAPKASKLIESNRGGIIFIDEAYVFAGPAQQFAQEALAEIMKELETNRTSFIFAGYSKEMDEFIDLNPGIESRIGYNMDFIDYTEEQLYQMLENKFRKGKYKFEESAKETIIKIIQEAKKSKNFGNGRFIDNLYMKIYLNHVSNVYMSDDLEELTTISYKDITENLMDKPKVKRIGF